MFRRIFIRNVLFAPFHAVSRRTHTLSHYILPFITKAFNTVDQDRLNTVGPDRTCAEWVLKNGGSVRFAEYPERVLVDYCELPDDLVTTTLREIDLTKSSVNGAGFNHLIGCKSVVSVILSNCKAVDDKAVNKLRFLDKSLMRLHLSHCNAVTDVGLQKVQYLTKLNEFSCNNLKGVKNFELILNELRKQLPNCKITNCEAE